MLNAIIGYLFGAVVYVLNAYFKDPDKQPTTKSRMAYAIVMCFSIAGVVFGLVNTIKAVNEAERIEQRNVEQFETVGEILGLVRSKVDSVNMVLLATDTLLQDLKKVDKETRGLLRDRQRSFQKIDSLNRMIDKQFEFERKVVLENGPEISIPNLELQWVGINSLLDSISIKVSNMGSRSAIVNKVEALLLIGQQNGDTFALYHDQYKKLSLIENSVISRNGGYLRADWNTGFNSSHTLEAWRALFLVNVNYRDPLTKRKQVVTFSFLSLSKDHFFSSYPLNEENKAMVRSVISDGNLNFQLEN